MAIGIYLHIPFCLSKCPYCDFYSLPLPEDAVLDRYVDRLVQEMEPFRGHPADTLYFGGGTPSLLGGARLTRLIDRAAAFFGLSGAEITLEANPGDALDETLRLFHAAGGNRLSIGLQSGSAAMLHTLGRRHSPEDFLRCVQSARNAGLDNLSADWMLALPGEGERPTDGTLALLRQADVSHVSAYLLKIEPGTPFARAKLPLPDEDATCAQYLSAVEQLTAAGWQQYEISNFARPGRESRHNLKYWNAEEYLGFGPAAHSFFAGRRSAYPRDLAGFLAGPTRAELPDDPALPNGSAEEYAMLRLRLTAGLTEQDFAARFGRPIPPAWRQRAQHIPAALLQADEAGLRLTPRGFLLSNEILRRLLDL